VTQRFALMLAVVVPACTAETETPTSVMFVADRSADRIVRFDTASGEYLGEVTYVDRPSSMRLGPDGMLYVAGFGVSEILRVDPAGAPPTRFFRNTEILEEPVEVLFRGGELVVLGHDTHNAIVIDPNGAMTHDIGYPDMRGAHDFGFANNGLLYVATEHDVVLKSAIQVWDVATGALVEHFGTLAQVRNASGIVAIDDSIYVTDYERGWLLHFDTVRHPNAIAVGLVHPIALELGPDGMFYVADERGIHRIARDGTYQSLVVPVGEHLVGPRGMTFATVDELGWR
jgi:sugar lactone lactonase YvrE